MEQKEYLDLSCRFARRKFYDKEKKKYTHYISGETVVDEEKIRFKLNDKDSRLFQYMLKKMGLIERDTRELKYETEEVILMTKFLLLLLCLSTLTMSTVYFFGHTPLTVE